MTQNFHLNISLTLNYARIYLSADIAAPLCSQKRTVFRERRLRETVSFGEQIMWSSCQIKVIVCAILQIFPLKAAQRRLTCFSDYKLSRLYDESEWARHARFVMKQKTTIYFARQKCDVWNGPETFHATSGRCILGSKQEVLHYFTWFPESILAGSDWTAVYLRNNKSISGHTLSPFLRFVLNIKVFKHPTSLALVYSESSWIKAVF